MSIDPDSWIVPRNWARFQHYSNRDVLWVKVYLELLYNPDYRNLSWPECGVMTSIWLLFAATSGQLQAKFVAASRPARFRYEWLEALNQAGFVEILAGRPPKLASKPLALARSRDREVLRTSLESASEPAQATGAHASAQQKDPAAALAEAHDLAAGWTGGDTDELEQAIDRIARKHGVRIGYLERVQLWDIAFG